MAFLFGIAIECGRDRVAAQRMANYFEDFEVALPGGAKGTVSARLEEEKRESGESNWWVNVYSNEFKSGAGSPELNSILAEIGRALYAKLRGAPRFRFALAGVEVLLALSFEDIPDMLADPQHLLQHYEGLVLTTEQVSGTRSEYLFEFFADGYRWIPYQGKHA